MIRMDDGVKSMAVRREVAGKMEEEWSGEDNDTVKSEWVGGRSVEEYEQMRE